MNDKPTSSTGTSDVFVAGQRVASNVPATFLPHVIAEHTGLPAAEIAEANRLLAQANLTAALKQFAMNDVADVVAGRSTIAELFDHYRTEAETDGADRDGETTFDLWEQAGPGVRRDVMLGAAWTASYADDLPALPGIPYNARRAAAMLHREARAYEGGDDAGDGTEGGFLPGLPGAPLTHSAAMLATTYLTDSGESDTHKLAAYLYLTYAAFLPQLSGSEAPAEKRKADTRTWTEDRPTPGGGTTVHVKRVCDGCGEKIGDVTDAEMAAATAGAPLPTVTAECPRCAPAAGDGPTAESVLRELNTADPGEVARAVFLGVSEMLANAAETGMVVTAEGRRKVWSRVAAMAEHAATMPADSTSVAVLISYLSDALDRAGGEIAAAAGDELALDAWVAAEPEWRACTLLYLAWTGRLYPLVRAGDPIAEEYAASLSDYAAGYDLNTHGPSPAGFFGERFPAMPLPGPAGALATSIAFDRSEPEIGLSTALTLLYSLRLGRKHD